MANKTIAVQLSALKGLTGLKLRLLSAGVLINTGGTTLTETTNGWFACTIAAAITGGWFDVEIVNANGGLEAFGGKLYIPADAVGTYVVDDPAATVASIRADLERVGGPLLSSGSGGVDTEALAQQIVDLVATSETSPLAILQTPSAAGPLFAHRSTTWKIRLLGLPAASDWKRAWFSIKRRDNTTDDAAVVRLQVSKDDSDKPTDGLQRLVGRAADATAEESGALEVIQTTPTLTLEIQLSAAASLAIAAGEYVYDVKLRTLAGVELRVEPDAFEVRAVITRAVA